MSVTKPFWIMRDYAKCSGCRRCEIACSLRHEGRIWPEASRVRVFMLFPGLEVPYLCSQCVDTPCVGSCPVGALDIYKPEDNVYLAALIDEAGLCGIQAGNVLGFAGELYQRGILTKEDIGFELKWGDTDAFAKLIDMIVYRKGVGNILADGAYRAALRLGKMKGLDLTKYAITSKGIGLGAHGIRSGLDYTIAISYACSVQGGDHTSVAYLPIDHPSSELTVVLHDSGVYCSFNTYAPGTRDKLWEFYTAVRGWELNRERWYSTDARRIIDIQRAALLIGGPDLRWRPYADDVNPERFYEPLPSGPHKGKTMVRAEVDRDVKEYYRQMGWDELGIPTSEELRRLGLQYVDMKLKEIR